MIMMVAFVAAGADTWYLPAVEQVSGGLLR
jgi:hypothetical protein